MGNRVKHNSERIGGGGYHDYSGRFNFYVDGVNGQIDCKYEGKYGS